jgi:hypothetical protein
LPDKEVALGASDGTNRAAPRRAVTSTEVVRGKREGPRSLRNPGHRENQMPPEVETKAGGNMNPVRSLIILAAFLCLPAALVRAQTPAPVTPSAEELSQRLDSLEVKLEQIVRENVDNSPFATGETLNWGRGWFFGTSVASPNREGFEIGYMHGFRTWRPPWENPYIGQRPGYRIGLSAGLEVLHDSGFLHKDNGEPYYASSLAPYIRVTYGSPVLLNFISATGYVQPMCLIPDLARGDSRSDKARAGLSIGTEMEFWIARDKCISLGYSMDGQLDQYFETKKWNQDTLLPHEFHTRAGVKAFF